VRGASERAVPTATAELERLCGELGGQRMDLFRASLELALAVFREHPEYFVYVVEKAVKEW